MIGKAQSITKSEASYMKIIITTVANHSPRRRQATSKVNSSRSHREVAWPKNNQAHDQMKLKRKSLHNRNLASIIQPKDLIWKYRKTKVQKLSRSIDIIWGSRVKLLLIIVTGMKISSASIWIPVITQHSTKCQIIQPKIQINMESKSLWRRNSTSKIILDIVRAP